MESQDLWKILKPDKHNDWIKQRDNSFEEFIKIGSKKKESAILLFHNYSQGLLTARDN